MPQDPASVWKSEFKNLPKVGTSVADGMTNLANFVDARVSNKLILAPPLGGTFTYTFNKAAFLAPLLSLQPVKDTSGMMTLANAWQSAALASIMITAPGSYVGAPAPPTTFASVVTVVDPASVALAYATLLSNLLSAKPVADDPPFPIYFRDAFAALKFNLSGMNMLPPPAGPLPLVAAQVGVL